MAVDVSAKQLHAARLGARGRLLETTFRNDASGYARLITWAMRGGRRAQVCVEATGLYSLPLALALHAHKHTDVMVVNPRAIKVFGDALLQRAKTDRTDADVIRTFAAQMPFVVWQPPPQEALQLQALMRRVNQLKVMLSQAMNRAHAYRYRATHAQWTTANIQDHCAYLQAEIDRLEEQAITVVQSTCRSWAPSATNPYESPFTKSSSLPVRKRSKPSSPSCANYCAVFGA